MKLDLLVFVLTLAMGALLVAAFLLPEADTVTGQAHPTFQGMRQGGDGAGRHLALMPLAWLFGSLQIALFAALIAFGARQRDHLRGLTRPLLIVTGLYLVVWSLLLLAYRSFLHEPATGWLWFPAPTAIMLYVLWPLPVLYVVLYARGFKRWVMTESDIREFRRLLEQVRGDRSRRENRD